MRIRFIMFLKIFIQGFNFFLLLILVIGCESVAKKNQVTPYKNVVVIIGDDHAYTAIGAYGNQKINTPNIDWLAQNGAMFTNAYSNSPVCSASRQSLLTGKYPHQTGVNLLFTPFNDKINTTIAEHCKVNGFVTALIGKAHFNSFIWDRLYKEEYPKFGFDTLIDRQQYHQWLKENPPVPVPDSIKTFSRNEKGIPDHVARMNPFTLPQNYYDKDAEGTFLANAAIQFIEKNRDERIMLWLAFHEPHAPFAFPVEYTGKYKAENMALPAGSPEDDRWIPERFKGFTDKQKKGIIASYYTSVEYLDKNIGLVIDALKQKGIFEETLIVYLGDQGYLLYDHKRFEKHTMWEESIKAPLILKGKTIPKNFKSNTLIEFIDVTPTICDLLGLEKMNEAVGISFANIFIDEKPYKEKEFVFAEFLEDNKAMVATKKWKYIFTTGKRDLGQGFQTGNGPSGIYHRLYNLEIDPGETKNLAYEKEYLNTLKEMQNKMLNPFLDTHPYANELPFFKNIEGKLAWFCEPRDVGAEYGGEPLRIYKYKNLIKNGK